jgi:hypothetical protein
VRLCSSIRGWTFKSFILLPLFLFLRLLYYYYYYDYCCCCFYCCSDGDPLFLLALSFFISFSFDLVYLRIYEYVYTHKRYNIYREKKKRLSKYENALLFLSNTIPRSYICIMYIIVFALLYSPRLASIYSHFSIRLAFLYI